MKAIVRTKYGSPDVLQLEDVEKPTPTDNEVLVRVYAVSINKADAYILRGPLVARLAAGGLLKPKNKILGTDIAGRVEAVGGNVKQFKLGDDVFGCCRGGFAEYAIAREDRLVLKPANAAFEEAAAVPVAATTALQALRKGNVQPGQKVLINGASGGVGSFAVQIAKSFGAEVTAVVSTGKLDMVRSSGADHAVDYTREDFSKSGERYDLIVQVNGYHSLIAYRRALCAKGTYVMVGGSRVLTGLLETALLGPLISTFGSKKMGFMGIARINQKDLTFLSELLGDNKIKPIIDKRFTLGEASEAFRYFEEGHTQGKVVISLQSKSESTNT